jgi:transcription antitermination factor NusA-like protein
MSNIFWILIILVAFFLLAVIGFILIISLILFSHILEKFELLILRYLIPFCKQLPRLYKWIDKQQVALSIQSTINSVCNQINSGAPGIIPHQIKIQWVKTDTPESFIDRDKAVVRLRYFPNQDKNIVTSTLYYLNVGLLPRAKNLLDKNLLKSCLLKVANNIFASRKDTGASDYFLENEYYPIIKENPSIGEDISLLDSLDLVGFFHRVFLNEIRFTQQKLLSRVPSELMRKEVREFAVFLQRIATKIEKQNVPLLFNGAKIRAGIILVARKDLIERYDIKPYINRLKIMIRQGIESIYIAGWGNEFIKKVKEIKDAINMKHVIIVSNQYYNLGPNLKAMLIYCQANIEYLTKIKEAQNEFIDFMKKIIPDIEKGNIEITSVARLEGIGTKVAVCSTIGKSPTEVKNICIGENYDKIDYMRKNYQNELIDIIAWEDDNKKKIINALFPLRPEEVEDIEIDEDDFIANVKIMTDTALRKAFGKNYINLRLANELTGYEIFLIGPKDEIKEINPEDQLRKYLFRIIPEIRNGKIEIVHLARTPNAGSKIIVKWKEGEHKMTNLASKVCQGKDFENVDKIKILTSGEFIYFYEWTGDIKRQIKTCLYPIKEADIMTIDIDDKSKTAVITFKDEVGAEERVGAIISIELCEKVTGWKIEIH